MKPERAYDSRRTMDLQNNTIFPYSSVHGLEDIPDKFYTHGTVNHSEGFVNGHVCTNTIEGTWFGIKSKIALRHRTKELVPWMLVEFIWRRKHYGDIMGGIRNVLSQVSFNRLESNPAWLTEFQNDNEVVETTSDDDDSINLEDQSIEDSRESDHESSDYESSDF